ncbi:MAG: glycerol-3-phosphate acyltransferase [Clostridia bacterium]|nr:glycerol-3-phosphate acyltransferase [Clostridia bacterium]
MLIPMLSSALGGYLIGNFNLAYILAKGKGFDIRSRGSNNPGASNAAITLGWKAGVIVALADILKAAVAVLLSRLLFANEPAALFAGVAAVMGHMYPFWLRFKGGKGFASFAGMALGVDWRYFAIIGAAVIAVILISDYIVLGTLTAVVTFPISYGILNRTLWALLIAAVSLIIILKHIPNFIRIAKGTERRVIAVLTKKKNDP